jgi:2,3-bisphosphoglycerate-independent phosphoglycerate mutase
MNSEKKALLIILDGWGHRSEKKDNAIAQGHTPFYDKLLQTQPWTLLDASETSVGLPSGVMGNSEVGHMNIGAGRKVVQDQVRIFEAIAQDQFASNPVFLEAICLAGSSGKKLHLVGLVSRGNVHSAQEHLYALLNTAAQHIDMDQCYVHAILDGRDTAPKSAKTYVEELQKKLAQVGGSVASMIGRFYAMDRDQRWERIEKAYQLMVHGQGTVASDLLSAIDASYDQGITDEFLEPVWAKGSKGKIEPGDAVIFFNFRADRMRQLVRVLCDYEHGLTLPQPVQAQGFSMTQYDRTFSLPVAFAPQDLSLCLGEHLSACQKSQFRIAETEKYAHVTFFFNGGREKPYAQEARQLIASPKVRTYDMAPAMNSQQVTQALRKRMQNERDDFMVVNFAQPDMVGHTGNWDAALEAVRATDQCLQAIYDTALSQGYTVFLTADHGNIEMMKDEKGQVHTAHTLHPVPLIVKAPDALNFQLASGGSLSNISPTIIECMGLPVPSVMTSASLLRG